MTYFTLSVLVCALAAGTVQAAVQTRDVEYRDGQAMLQGYLA